MSNNKSLAGALHRLAEKLMDNSLLLEEASKELLAAQRQIEEKDAEIEELRRGK